MVLATAVMLSSVCACGSGSKPPTTPVPAPPTSATGGGGQPPTGGGGETTGDGGETTGGGGETTGGYETPRYETPRYETPDYQTPGYETPGGEETTGGGGGETTGRGGGGVVSPALNPNGPDLVLYSLPECTFAPNGGNGGADGLIIWVSLRNEGPGTPPNLVPYELASDTGLRGGSKSTVSEGTNAVAMGVALRNFDFYRTHTFTVTVDPANEIVETNESNNTLTVVVDLAGRPSRTQNVACRP